MHEQHNYNHNITTQPHSYSYIATCICRVAVASWWAEGILCRVKKLRNPICQRQLGSIYESMPSQENFEFQPIKIAFWVILHQTHMHVVITYSSCTKFSWQLQAKCVNTRWNEVECLQLHNKQVNSEGANMDFLKMEMLQPPCPPLPMPMV